MNLFRSEEHVRRWSGLNPEAVNETIALPELVAVMGTESRRHWLDDNYGHAGYRTALANGLRCFSASADPHSGCRHTERA